MRKHRFLPLALILAMLLSVYCTWAYAASGYTGELDPETGEPIQEAAETSSSNRVTVSDGVYYDQERLGYVYNVNDQMELFCSVVDGMVVQRNVRVEADEGVDVTLYLDGEAVADPDLTNIFKVGNYVVEVSVGGQTYQPVSFSIIGSMTNAMTGYNMPDGFVITEVTLDGEDIYEDRGYVSMATEGHYVVNYRCARSGMTYELDVIIDTTPPVLALSELNDRNQARGPVSIADVEEGASAVVLLDGKQITYKSELTESGEYQVILTDRAGNVSQYSFTILVYFDMNSLLFLGLTLAALASVGAYVVISRKKLAVR